MDIVPFVGERNPAMSFIMVDLPDHDGPMRAVFLPPANTIFIFLIADSSFSL